MLVPPGKCSIIVGMVEVGLAFVCALVAWSATASLGVRAYRYPDIATIAWAVSATATAIALSAAFPAALLDFSNATFRLLHIGIGLIGPLDRKSTRLNSSHVKISYAVFCLKKKINKQTATV